MLQGNEPDTILAALHRAGVDIRPEAMGVSWEDAAEALRTLAAYVREAGLWYTVAEVTPVTEAFLEQVREGLYATYGPWQGAA
jgi:glycerol-1-phosphate dehydrogenase [NAD(P)+]